jgi:tRNA(adenine34) deaminase
MNITPMQLALKEAIKGFDAKEVPIGCVILHDNKVIARAHNQVELLRDPTAHAEMIAITQASEALESWRLFECTLYTTLEPCPMCSGAIQLARIDTVVIGAMDPKKGACGSLINLLEDSRFNHTCEIHTGVMAEDSSALLSEFFKRLRKKSI